MFQEDYPKILAYLRNPKTSSAEIKKEAGSKKWSKKYYLRSEVPPVSFLAEALILTKFPQGDADVVEGISFANWPIMVRNSSKDPNGIRLPDKVLVPPEAKAALCIAVHRSSHHGQNKTFTLVIPFFLLIR
jgi:hypothetical protein